MSHRNTERLSAHSQLPERITIFLAILGSHCVAFKAVLTACRRCKVVKSVNAPDVTCGWQEVWLPAIEKSAKVCVHSWSWVLFGNQQNLTTTRQKTFNSCSFVYFYCLSVNLLSVEQEPTHRHIAQRKKKLLSLGTLCRANLRGRDVTEAPFAETLLWTVGMFNSCQNL